MLSYDILEQDGLYYLVECLDGYEIKKILFSKFKEDIVLALFLASSRLLDSIKESPRGGLLVIENKAKVKIKKQVKQFFSNEFERLIKKSRKQAINFPSFKKQKGFIFYEDSLIQKNLLLEAPVSFIIKNQEELNKKNLNFNNKIFISS